MVNVPFREYLLAENLIEIEKPLGTYHFKAPWDPDKLAALGIRYVMGPKLDREAMADGWKLLAYGEGVLYVYENPLPVGLVYFKDKDGVRRPLDADRMSFRGGEIGIELPATGTAGELVATFIHIPGWKAWVNGIEREIVSGKDHLMRMLIHPGDREIVMRFRPFMWYHFTGWVLAALGIPGIALWFTHRYPGNVFRS